ncbi:hypothetical protein Tco_0753761 [Tanacetum coccineum]
MTGVMTELILRECMEKAPAKSSFAKPTVDDNVKIELITEYLMELQNNAYNGSEEEDVIDHIAKVLEILDSIKIKIPNVDTDLLHVHVFPFSLTGAAQKWWINEGRDKITTWSKIVGRFFCKYYPVSHAGKYNIIEDDEKDGPDYLEVIIWLISKCKGHKCMDGTTKTALLHNWLKEEGNNELMDDIESTDEEWEESDFGNHPNTNTNSFFKPYLDAQEKNDIEKGDERSQKKYKGNTSKLENIILNKAPHSINIKDEQLSERVCKAEKFKVIKYSLGPNEEYIAINNCECNA